MQDVSAVQNPQTEEVKAAERILLGILLVDGSRFDEVADLSPEVFLTYPCRQIFEVMLDLYRQDEKIDAVSVGYRFDGKKSLIEELLQSSCLRN